MEKEYVEVYGTTCDTLHSWYVCSELSISQKKSSLQWVTLKTVFAKSPHLDSFHLSRSVEQTEGYVEYLFENSKPIRISNGHYSELVLLPEAISNNN